MKTSLGHRAFLQTARACTKDITGLIRLQETAAIPRVEVAETFRAAFTAINVLRLQGSRLESFVLSLRRKHTGLGAHDLANIDDISILIVLVFVHRRQWVSDAAGFENLMSDITVIHLRALEWALTLPKNMPSLRLAALDSTDAQNVPRLQVSMLILDWPSTINVVNILLVT